MVLSYENVSTPLGGAVLDEVDAELMNAFLMS
jgi:hypothetical protein